MADPHAPPPPRASLVQAMKSSEALLREVGREFLVAFYTGLRSLKLYPVENDQVQRALDGITAVGKRLYDVESTLELRVSSEFLYVNSVRLRLSLDNYATFSHVLTTLRQCGVGTMEIADGVTRREWQIFLSQLLAYAPRGA